MARRSTEVIVIQEIETAHAPLHLSQHLTTILSKTGYQLVEREPEAFVWKRRDRKESLFLNYYTLANSLTLRRRINPATTEDILRHEAGSAYHDLQKITDELATSVGRPHMSSRIQVEFGVGGNGAQTVFEIVLPVVRNLHSVKYGFVNVDVDMLESTPQATRALLTPFNLVGE